MLWRELCVSRAPRMVSALTLAGSSSAPGSARVGGGWPALAKLLLYCCGSAGTSVGAGVPGHFAPRLPVLKTSGRSFLSRRCGEDLLYVSDPCEHAVPGHDVDGQDMGAYRGFMRSRTRAGLVGGRAPLEPHVRCPYCGARVWSCWLARLFSSEGEGDGGSGSRSDDDDGFSSEEEDDRRMAM